MADPPVTVGARIRMLRQSRGMTQQDLAQACDVTRSAVAQWETDRAGQLRSHISKIAETLGVDTEFLLHGARSGENLTGDEIALLRLYRICSAEDRALLLRTARRLAPRPGAASGDS